jgi:hypothetical protein
LYVGVGGARLREVVGNRERNAVNIGKGKHNWVSSSWVQRLRFSFGFFSEGLMESEVSTRSLAHGEDPQEL